MSLAEQRVLSADQVAEFHHMVFVNDQIADFRSLVEPWLREASALMGNGVVLDIGGGAGYFAAALRESLGSSVRVLDMDPGSVALCAQRGVEARLGDADKVEPTGDERVICFNLILHHLVSGSARDTRALQIRALARWRSPQVRVFVNEYIYESLWADVSGYLIYIITSSRVLSSIGSLVARMVPALRANTFGVGVRFRAEVAWVRLFREAGFETQALAKGREERVPLPLRLLLIRSIRRTSFLLAPAGTESSGVAG